MTERRAFPLEGIVLLYFLFYLPNVIVTPHIAGEPAGYAERVVTQVFADNLACYRAGRPLKNVVDLARGY